MQMRRYDFVAAYLQGELEEGEVTYCYPPPGYPGPNGKDGRQRVYKVIKPIYGMAQAGRRWQRSLYPWLTEWGFVACHADANTFTLERDMGTPDAPRVERLILGFNGTIIGVLTDHFKSFEICN